MPMTILFLALLVGLVGCWVASLPNLPSWATGLAASVAVGSVVFVPLSGLL